MWQGVLGVNSMGSRDELYKGPTLTVLDRVLVHFQISHSPRQNANITALDMRAIVPAFATVALPSMVKRERICE